jgi:KUP system potassium uptake protein
VHITSIAPSLLRVTAHYGFMQNPRISQILGLCRKQMDAEVLAEPIYYFLARPRVVPAGHPGAMPRWRRILYEYMLRNARPFTDSLGLPPDRIVEFGVTIPV